jgi:hypothetical protein
LKATNDEAAPANRKRIRLNANTALAERSTSKYSVIAVDYSNSGACAPSTSLENGGFDPNLRGACNAMLRRSTMSSLAMEVSRSKLKSLRPKAKEPRSMCQ